jgi:hypothetical protein
VELCLDLVLSDTSSYYTQTHTSYFLNTSPTNNFSLHTTPLHTWPVLKNFVFIRGTWQDWTAGHLTTGCWAVWLQVWHPWLVLKTSLILIWYRPVFCFHCPKPVQISGLGTGTRLSYSHSSQTAYWGMIIQSSLTSCNAVQCRIISVVYWLNYLQASLFISIQGN